MLGPDVFLNVGLICFLRLHITGAILAIGHGGRETTLWPAQKQFFLQKK